MLTSTDLLNGNQRLKTKINKTNYEKKDQRNFLGFSGIPVNAAGIYNIFKRTEDYHV